MIRSQFSSFAFAYILIQCFTVDANHLSPDRVKRGIFGTYTTTVYNTIEEKHYVPAKCIYFEPNLPDCRNVRFLNFPNFYQNPLNYFNTGNEISTSTPDDSNDKAANDIKITRRADFDQQNIDRTNTVYMQGWGEYLGFYRPTVTVTENKIVPTTVVDTRVVVTYAIKGCKPHNLPENLEKCPEEESLELVEILPTSTVQTRIRATKVPNISPEKISVLESEVSVEDELPGSDEPTKSLQ